VTQLDGYSEFRFLERPDVAIVHAEPSRELVLWSEMVRRMIDFTVSNGPSAEHLQRLRLQIEALEDWRCHARSRFPHPDADREASVYPLHSHPVFGTCNPAAPPFRIFPQPEGLGATGAFGAATEGYRGVAFGGAIASIFDAIAGTAAAYAGYPGFVRSLSIEYLAVVPTDTDLRAEARVSQVDGRSVFVSASMHVEPGPDARVSPDGPLATAVARIVVGDVVGASR
jgi:acyl-coenzyme A thioesterase PaaI-like protein